MKLIITFGGLAYVFQGKLDGVVVGSH